MHRRWRAACWALPALTMANFIAPMPSWHGNDYIVALVSEPSQADGALSHQGTITMAGTDSSAHRSGLSNVRLFAMGPGLLVLAMVAIVAMFPPQFAHPSQGAALEPKVAVPILLMAMAGVYVAARTNMTANPLDPALRRRALVHAVCGGVLIGLLTVAADHAAGFSSAIAATLHIPSIHIGFPESAYVYAAGGVLVECLYRFIPVSMLYGLIVLVTRRRHEAAVFWTLGILTALIEPLSQAPLAGQAVGVVAPLFGLIFIFNLTELWLWRRYGWIAPVVSRLCFYGVWHVAVGPVLTGTI